MEAFSEFLRRIGGHNLLVLGIVILAAWLLISGFRKGWQKRGDDEDSDEPNDGDDDSAPDP